MGLLVPIEHPERLDVAAAARLMHALGETTIHVSGLRPAGADIDRVIAALVPGRDNTISYENGHLPLDELEPIVLATDGAFYTDACTHEANVRVWSDHAWVHLTPMPLGGIEEVARVMSDVFGVTVAPRPGAQVIGTLEIQLATTTLAADIRTPDRAAAYRYFRRTCGPRTRLFGHCSGPSRGALDHMPRFLHATGGDVRIDCQIDPDVLVALGLPFDSWQMDSIEYEPEEGIIRTYFVAPVKPADEADWLGMIDRGLALSRVSRG